MSEMDRETAEHVLREQVYLPTFVEKCAADGVTFPDQETLSIALQTVDKINVAASTKQASLMQRAHDALCKAAGLPTPEQEQTVADAQQAQAKQAVDAVQVEQVRKAAAALLTPVA